MKKLSDFELAETTQKTLRWLDDNGELVAMVTVDLTPNNNGHYEMSDFTVCKKYRKNGLSHQILKYIIEQYHVNMTYVHKDNDIAMHVYEKAGFKIDENYANVYFYVMYR